MGEAAEAIVGDVQARALFQQEGVAHGFVRAFAEYSGGGLAADGHYPDVLRGFACFAAGDEDDVHSFHFFRGGFLDVCE